MNRPNDRCEGYDLDCINVDLVVGIQDVSPPQFSMIMPAAESMQQQDTKKGIRQRVVNGVKAPTGSEEQIDHSQRRSDRKRGDSQLYCLLERSRVGDEECPRAQRAVLMGTIDPLEEAIIAEDVAARSLHRAGRLVAADDAVVVDRRG